MTYGIAGALIIAVVLAMATDHWMARKMVSLYQEQMMMRYKEIAELRQRVEDLEESQCRSKNCEVDGNASKDERTKALARLREISSDLPVDADGNWAEQS